VGDPIRRRLALADEFGLMAKLSQDGVEHDAAERIVLDAEQAQRPRRAERHRTVGTGIRCRALRRRHQDIEGESGAAAAPLRRSDIAAHGAGQLPDRRQAEPGPAELRRNRDVGLRERPEQPLDLVERQADAAVRDGEGDGDLALRTAHRRDLKRDTAGFGELHGVVDQVLHRRAQADGIADRKPRQLVGYRNRGLQPLRRRAPGQRITGVAGERAQVEEILPHVEARTAAARRIDEQGRQARQMFGAGLDGIDPASFALAEFRGREQIADRKNAGERRANLVREGRKRGLDHVGSSDGRLAGDTRLRRGAGCPLLRSLLHWPCDAPWTLRRHVPPSSTATA